MVSFDNKVLVPFHFNNLDLVLLLLPFVLGNDDEVGVGALVDFLDRVVQDPLHIYLPREKLILEKFSLNIFTTFMAVRLGWK